MRILRPAILVVDMLEDFVRGKLGDERFEGIVPPLRKLLETARERNVPVIYCNDSHGENDPEMELWGEHAMKGSQGAKVIEELEPEEGDTVVEKSCYGCFEGTDLEEKLGRLYGGRGADTVVITGLHTHLCDRHTAYGAFARGYDIVFVEDGTDAFTEEQHEEGLEYAEEYYGADLESSEELVKKLGN